MMQAVKVGAHILQLLPHVCILLNQMSDLFLKALVLLHQKFVHCSQLPIDSLKTRSLLPLLLTASESTKLLEPKHISYRRFTNKTQDHFSKNMIGYNSALCLTKRGEKIKETKRLKFY